MIAGLRELARTTAIRGNIDTGRWAKGYPRTARLTLGGRSIHVLPRQGVQILPATQARQRSAVRHVFRPRPVFYG